VLARIAPPPSAGYGWSRYADLPSAFDGFRLLINLEQRPHPDNRVVLGQGTDALGVPVAHLHWRWRNEEQRELERVRSLVTGAIEAAGLGRVRLAGATTPDPNSHHHAGTTRMSEDPRDGVVDSTGRVHQLENLFVTGASVFPTAGFANPTLTIVALADRLAGHLAGAGSS
jgi:choline dehydrogenase-like flavoprotein